MNIDIISTISSVLVLLAVINLIIHANKLAKENKKLVIKIKRLMKEKNQEFPDYSNILEEPPHPGEK